MTGCWRVLAVLAILARGVTADAQEASRDDNFLAAARWQKFRRDTFAAPGPYLGAAIGGAFDLAGDSPKEWGQDFDSYGAHVGDNFGRNLVQQSLTQAGQSLLELDPAYRRCSCTGAGRRAVNALAGMFTSFDRRGRRRFDPSYAIGAYGSGMAATLWYPDRYDPRVKGFQLGHEQFAAVPLANLIQEFSPELKRINPFRKRK